MSALWSIYISYQWLTHKPKMHKTHHKKRVPKIDFVTLYPKEYRFKEEVYFLIEPYETAELKPRVSSSVEWLNPKIFTYETIKKNEILIKLDRSDFELDLIEARAKVAQAETALLQERKKSERAKKELQILNRPLTESQKDFLLRKPYLKEAEKNLEAAKAALKRAELNIKRCTITAPFDMKVSEVLTFKNDVVSASKILLKGYRVDKMILKTLIDPEKIEYLSKESYLKFKDSKFPLLGFSKELENKSRLLYVKFLAQEAENIFLNDFRWGEIEGKTVKNVYKIPKSGIGADNTVWTVQKNRLKKVKIEPLWSFKDYVYAKTDRDSIDFVPSVPPAAYEGMKIAPAKSDR